MAVIDLTPARIGLDIGRGPRAGGGLNLGRMPARDPVGEAVEQFGATMQRVAEAEAEARDVTEINSARATALRDLSTLRGELEQGQHGENITEAYDARSQEIIARVAGGMSSGNARQRFQNSADMMVAGDRLEVVRFAARRTAERGRADLSRSLAELATAASGEADQGRRAIRIQEANAAIERAVSANYLGADDGERFRQGFMSELQEADVRRLIATNPAQAVAALQRSDTFDALRPSARAQFLQSAAQQVEIRRSRAEAAAARQERVLAAEVRTVDDMMLAGFVPEDRLAALRTASRGTALASTVERLERDAREIQTWTTTPAARQAERLAEMRTRLEGGTGSPEDFAQYRRLVQVAQAQQRDVAERGVARGVQDRILDPLPPLDWSNPETLNARVAAAGLAAAHYGRPVAPFTDAEARQFAETFARGTPEQQMALVSTAAGITDTDARREAFRLLERARGDGARIPAGGLYRVADLARGSIREQQAARTILSAFAADVSDRVQQAGESQELRAALVSAQDRQVQGAYRRQAQIAGPAGGGGYVGLLTRDMDMIGRVAAYNMAIGGMSPTRAVEAAQTTVNTGRGFATEGDVGAVFFPARGATSGEAAAGMVVQPAEVATGLRTLRDRAASVVSVDPAMGAEQAVTARARLASIRRGQWVNEGDGFALVQPGDGLVLMRATLREVLDAAGEQAARDAARPPVMRREDALERTRREQRQQPPPPATIPPRRQPPVIQ